MAARFVLILFVAMVLTMVIVTAPDGTRDRAEARDTEASEAEVARMRQLERRAVAQTLARTPNLKSEPDQPEQAAVESSKAGDKPMAEEKPVPKPAPASPKERTVKVRDGDSLSAISKRVYGSATKWRLIYEANRSKLKAPDALKVGMILKVPERPDRR